MTLKGRYQLVSQQNQWSQTTEQYRIIRTNIQYAGITHDPRTILVTSAKEKEGKTITAANLAIVYAQMGKNVLLIDADMRRPQLHRAFATSNIMGLSTVLIREATVSACLTKMEDPNLNLLPCGPTPPNPSEMLSSESFRELIDWGRNQFDLVIVDSPPVMAVSDPLVLSNLLDGTILVVDAKHSNRHAVRKSILALEQVNARIIGVVLNHCHRKKKEYYQYHDHESITV